MESVAEKIWREWVKGCIFALRFWKSVSSLSIWLSGNKEGVKLKNSFEKRKINLAGMKKPFTFALPIEGKGLKKKGSLDSKNDRCGARFFRKAGWPKVGSQPRHSSSSRKRFEVSDPWRF